MFEQNFYNTRLSEAFAQSQCLFHEQSLIAMIESILISFGYQRIDQHQWQKQDRTVIVCFVDDFRICSKRFNGSPEQWFDSNTTVITDNWLPFATPYLMCKVPDSYSGIYRYVPADQNYCPDKRFHISLNRLDAQRLLLFFEYYCSAGGIDSDYVNFNCRPGDITMSVDQIHDFFDSVWHEIQPKYQPQYHDAYHQTRTLIPIKNHNVTIEQACLRAYVNLVVETYAGDQTVTFSEKIFRALVTPAPWIVYAARHSVSRLKSLGFDVLDDIVDHSYDSTLQDISYMGVNKIKNFVAHSHKVYSDLVKLPTNHLVTRCSQAARHNQRLLADQAGIWPRQCATWLTELIDKIQ